jgi:DNA (cytosine-5)-methyltransferase 1
VCSGIEAASVAWEPLGWTPVAFAEIEKFPSKVLAHHYPGVPNLGDMTQFREWDIERGAVDVLVGGTPCQSFSVAGLRKGLDDPRGNLALTFVAMVDHYRPEWVIWENVPGVLSSSGGRDFGSFLGALGQLGYGFAYRVLDAQYFGVPQRRRRVFVVAHSSGDSRRAGEILFEPENLSGNHKTSRTKGQGIADASITGSVSSKWANGTGGPAGDECYDLAPVMYQHNQTDARLKEEPKTSQTVIARFGTGGGHTPLVRHHVLVRKLTPTECERLQGFPDGYTGIMSNTPDSSRYIAIGNSMAVPVMRWIGKRIAGV